MNKSGTVQLVLQIDQQKLNELLSGFDAINRGMGSLNEQTGSLSTSASQSGQALVDFVKTLDSGVTEATDKVDKLNESLKETATTAGDVADAGDKVGGGFNVSSLRGAGRALNQLGLQEIGQPLQKIGDLGIIVKDLGTAAEAAGVSVTAGTVAFGGMEVALAPLLAVLLPVVAAVGAVAIAVKLMSDAAQKAADDEKAAYEQEKALLLEKENDRRLAKSKTQQQNQEDIDNLVQDRQDTMDALAKAQTARQNTANQYAALGSSFNPGERSRLGALGGQQDKDILDLENHLNDLNKQYVNNTAVLGPMIDAETAHKKAIEDAKKAQDDVDKGIEKGIQQSQQNQQLIDSSTSKSVQTRIDGIEAEKKAIEDALAINKASADETAKLKDQLSQLTDEEKNLTNEVLPAVKAREAATQAEKDFTKAVQDAEKELDSIGKAIDATVKGIADAQRNLDTQTRDAKEKSAFEASKIEEDKGTQLNKIATDYARKQVDLAQQAADQAAAALLSLNDTFAKDALSLQRNNQQDALNDLYKQQDIVRKAAEQEVLDKQAHLQKLQDIQHQYDDSNFQALLDRNFLQLAKNAEAQKTAITNENDHYSDLENQRQENLATQLGDEQIAYQRQREARLVAYQQQLQDANNQYEITIRNQQIANENKARDEELANQRSIEDLNTATQQKLTVVREGLAEEVKMYEQAEEDKINLLVQTQATLIAQQAQLLLNNPVVQTLGNIIGGVGSSIASAFGFASGGDFAAGQAFTFNEPGSTGNEAVQIGGASFGSRGQALVIPSSGGSVIPNVRGGHQITVNIPIYDASDPQRTADLVDQRIRNTLSEFVR